MDPNLLIVLLGTFTITSYQPIPSQTKPECRDRYHCTTSIDDGITQYGAAISQDMLRSGQVHYGDVIDVEGVGLRVVNDTMNKRHRKHVDLMVFSYAEEHKIGVQHRRVWLLHKGEPQCNTRRTQPRSQRRAVAPESPSEIRPSDTTVSLEGR